MRSFRILLATLLVWMLTAFAAGAQGNPPGNPSLSESTSTQEVVAFAPGRTDTADWNRVRDLARDDEIAVKARGESFRCLFDGATDQTLFCDPASSAWGAWGNASEYRIQRAEVKSIRMVQYRRNMKFAIGSMAVAGFIWGAVKGSNPGGGYAYPRVVVGLAGAALGALAGCVVAVPAALIPGRLVYRRASLPRALERGHVEAGQ
jgi:hypothetical protein